MNRDVLGWRAKFGVLAPSTNTIVQPEFDDLRPVGVTNHYSRIYTPNVAAVSDATMLAGIAGMGLAGLLLIGRRRVASLARSVSSSHHRRDGS